MEVAFRLIFRFVSLSASSTKEEKIGTFAMGFMIAKNPVKTESVNAISSFCKG